MRSRPLLLGHRGARATSSIPENTIASFEQAMAHGCDGFELDLRLTADGHVLICHDPQSRGKSVAHSRADELSELCHFDEVLERFAGRAFLDIELKVTGLEEKVRNAIRNREPNCGFVLSSFQPEILRTLYRMDKALPLGLISDRGADLEGWRNLPLDFVIPHHRLVNPALVEELHSAGKRLFVWTVNDRNAMMRLSNWGVDALISDHTELLIRTLRAIDG